MLKCFGMMTFLFATTICFAPLATAQVDNPSAPPATQSPDKDLIAPPETPIPEIAPAPAAAPAETAPAPETPAAAPKPASEPAPEAAPAKVAPPKAAPAPEIPAVVPTAEVAKELTAGAKALMPLAEGYKAAYEGMRKWVGEVDEKTAAVNDKIEKLQDQVQQNEALITKLKIEGTKASAARGKELAKENKQLWRDLSAARKERSALYSDFYRETAQRVKQYSTDSSDKLKAAKDQLK